MDIDMRMIILSIFLLFSGTSFANELAKCAVTFNILAKSYEAVGGKNRETEELIKASKILGKVLTESYSSQSKMMIEKEIEALKKYKKEDLINKLEINFIYCRKVLEIN